MFISYTSNSTINLRDGTAIRPREPQPPLLANFVIYLRYFLRYLFITKRYLFITKQMLWISINRTFLAIFQNEVDPMGSGLQPVANY